MTLKIRPMDGSDINAVYAIERVVHITPWNRKIISDCVLIGYDCRVLELYNEGSEDATIVGYIISRLHNKSYHVLNFCIAQRMQAQGLGKKFLQSVLDSIQNNSTIDNVTLEVRSSNTAALHLYLAMGFEKTGIKKEYYSNSLGTEDAIVLTKFL
jgi:ribosomal-protein-alanine N-acetyltransferase